MVTNKPSHQTWRLAALALATSLALTACGGEQAKQAEAQKKAAAQQQAPLPVVSVLTVQPENVLLENNLPGRLESQRSADIIPQVSGIVKRRLFQEGSFVRAGQPLYELDDDNYVASLASARASLLSAEAQLAKADADLERYRPLLKADAISKQEWDAALAAKRAAEAQVAAAQAAINAAQVNLNYTRVMAPISGRIGQSLVTEGALVNANTTQMAIITQNDPIYVNITQSSSEMLKLRQQIMSGQKVANPEVVVSLTLEDGSEYPHKGRLLFIDSNTDEKTGQVTLRAAIPNPNHLLLNGMYVRVNLPQVGVLGAYPVPQRAVTRGKTDTVLVINGEDKPESRTVKISGQREGFWIVTEGLKEGERVVVDGMSIANMMKGMGATKFQYKEWQPESLNQNDPSSAMSAPESNDAASDVPSVSEAVQAASEAQ